MIDPQIKLTDNSLYEVKRFCAIVGMKMVSNCRKVKHTIFIILIDHRRLPVDGRLRTH